MNKSLLTTVGIILAIVLSVYSAFRPAQETVREIVAGAVSSPDLPSPYFSFGGVRTWAYSMDIRTATSTLCSFQTPAATTSLQFLSAKFDTTASYATSYAWGNDPTAFSTTTIIVAPYGFGANARGEILASTTMVTAFAQNGVVPPNTYINLRISTSTAGVSAAYAPAGTCKVVFTEL